MSLSAHFLLCLPLFRMANAKMNRLVYNMHPTSIMPVLHTKQHIILNYLHVYVDYQQILKYLKCIYETII